MKHFWYSIFLYDFLILKKIINFSNLTDIEQLRSENMEQDKTTFPVEWYLPQHATELLLIEKCTVMSVFHAHKFLGAVQEVSRRRNKNW